MKVVLTLMCIVGDRMLSNLAIGLVVMLTMLIICVRNLLRLIVLRNAENGVVMMKTFALQLMLEH
jgi:hypothetical protein